MTKNTKNDRTLRDPLKSGDVLVTKKMLAETRAELKSDITSVKLEVRGLRSDMDSKFISMQGQMDARFISMESKMDSKFAHVDSQFDQLRALMETNLAKTHNFQALMEEQNARNVAVLEAYDQLYRQNEGFEMRLRKIEDSSLK
jgi:hypothetical protein